MSVFEVYCDYDGSRWELIYRSTEVDDGLTIISPHIQLATNKAPGFDFTINPDNRFYDLFLEFKTFVYVFRDEKCIFRGRVSNVKTDIFRQRTVTCEGDIACLSDSIQSPNTFIDVQTVSNTKKKKNVKRQENVKMTVERFFKSIIIGHNDQMTDSRKQFEIGNITVAKASSTEEFSLKSYSDTSSVVGKELLGRFGGIIQTRYDHASAITYIDYLDSYTQENNQEIRFGVNMLELDEELPDDDNPWSVLLPIGKDGLTIRGAGSSTSVSWLRINGIYIENTNALEKYGRIIHYEKFDDAKKASTLLKKAIEYATIHKNNYPNNLTVKAIDLQLVGESNDPLKLGDLIRVNAKSTHGIQRTLPCIEIDMDIQNPENSSYTMGTILPPDKQGKTTLSSKHSSARRSSSQRIGSLSDEVDGLARDTNTLGNNINVNAENIAACATNIAVNAENIRIAAKNIAIAADTIDIKADTLTATFEDETGKLSTLISITKEEIKSHIEDQVSGVSSTVTQTAESWAAKFEETSGDITGSFEITRNGIISEFNKTVYGPNLDGKGGVVADYRSRITQTAESLTSEYEKKLYGDGGTAENPKAGGIVEEYRSKIQQQADAIELRVEKKYIADTINKTKQESSTSAGIKISADKVELSGYVTVDALSVTNANIENLTSGRSVATSLVANTMYAKTRFSIGNDDDTGSATFFYNGSAINKRFVNLIGNDVLATVLASGTGNISLAHSHAVSVKNDGTVTLGAVSSTGGSFKIADTKAYKDGVSAARTEGVNSVTISSVGREMGVSDEYHGDSTSHYTEVHLEAKASNNATKTGTIYVYGTNAYNDGVNSVSDITNAWVVGTPTAVADDSDGVKDCANITIGVTLSNGKNSSNRTISKIPMWPVYNEGRSSVTVTSVDLDDDRSSVYDSSTKTASIPIIGKASNNAYKTGTINYYCGSAYNEGVNSVSKVTNAWVVGTPTAVADDSDGVKDCANITMGVTLENGNISQDFTINKVPMWPVYNAGYSDGITYGRNVAMDYLAISSIRQSGTTYYITVYTGSGSSQISKILTYKR